MVNKKLFSVYYCEVHVVPSEVKLWGLYSIIALVLPFFMLLLWRY